MLGVREVGEIGGDGFSYWTLVHILDKDEEIIISYLSMLVYEIREMKLIIRV